MGEPAIYRVHHYGDQDFAPVLFQQRFDQGVRDAREAEGVDERKRGSDPFLLRVQVVQELRDPLGERAFRNMDIERGRKARASPGRKPHTAKIRSTRCSRGEAAVRRACTSLTLRNLSQGFLWMFGSASFRAGFLGIRSSSTAYSKQAFKYVRICLTADFEYPSSAILFTSN